MPLVARTPAPNNSMPGRTLRRPMVFYVLLGVVGLVFSWRLFYLQVIKGEHYRAEATSEHQKKFEIPAKRGLVYAHDGERLVPLVLNETKELIYADPRYVTDKEKTASAVQEVLGGEKNDYQKLLETKSAYVILAKGVPKDKADQLKAKKLRGIGQTDTPARVYPQGQLASQILGFVNGDGDGQYGIEDFFNGQLKGKTGLLKAVTDINGVPLAAGESSVQQTPKDGESVNLTIDVNVQRYVEDVLKDTAQKTKAKATSAVVLDTRDGSIKAMGNYPTYDPSKFSDIKADDYAVFSNRIVTTPYEAGSVMKVFTMSTALNEGVIQRDSTFPDTGSVQVEDRVIKNSVNWGSATRPMTEILQKSLNTGVVWILKQMGGGEIDKQARERLRGYLVDHFRFNQTTGIQLAGEAAGQIAGANTGDGDNVRYANMAFGQGMTVTMLQVANGLLSVIDGGTYYKPSIVEKESGTVLARDVVKAQTGGDLREMMRAVIHGSPFDKKGYYIGGKSGTSQLLDANGNYSEDKTTGSYLGFIGSKSAQYVIMVRVDEPTTQGFSGTTAAAPLFSGICDYLIQYYGIPAGS